MEENPSWIIQKKSLGAITSALCPTMDLIAIVNKDDIITVYRTFSWEKIYSSKVSDHFSNEKLTCLSFNPDGKILSISGSEGSIKMIILETGASYSAWRRKKDQKLKAPKYCKEIFINENEENEIYTEKEEEKIIEQNQNQQEEEIVLGRFKWGSSAINENEDKKIKEKEEEEKKKKVEENDDDEEIIIQEDKDSIEWMSWLQFPIILKQGFELFTVGMEDLIQHPDIISSTSQEINNTNLSDDIYISYCQEFIQYLSSLDENLLYNEDNIELNYNSFSNSCSISTNENKISIDIENKINEINSISKNNLSNSSNIKNLLFLLFTINKQNKLQIFTQTGYPFFSIQLNINTKNNFYNQFLIWNNKNNWSYGYNSFNINDNSLINSTYLNKMNLFNEYSLNSSYLNYFPFVYNISYIELLISYGLKHCLSIIHQLNKKFKENLKFIPLKFNFLINLMKSYDLKMSLIEFLYSISILDTWHPISKMFFTQYFDDGNLIKNINNIKNFMKLSLRSINFSLIPWISNIKLLLNNYLNNLKVLINYYIKLYYKLNQNNENNNNKKELLYINIKKLIEFKNIVINNLLNLCTILLFSVENFKIEFTLCNKNLILLINFIKLCRNDIKRIENLKSNNEDDPNKNKESRSPCLCGKNCLNLCSFELNIKKKVSKIFNTSKNRVKSESNPEYFTNTLVFKHFLEAPYSEKKKFKESKSNKNYLMLSNFINELSTIDFDSTLDQYDPFISIENILNMNAFEEDMNDDKRNDVKKNSKNKKLDYINLYLLHCFNQFQNYFNTYKGLFSNLISDIETINIEQIQSNFILNKENETSIQHEIISIHTDVLNSIKINLNNKKILLNDVKISNILLKINTSYYLLILIDSKESNQTYVNFLLLNSSNYITDSNNKKLNFKNRNFNPISTYNYYSNSSENLLILWKDLNSSSFLTTSSTSNNKLLYGLEKINLNELDFRQFDLKKESNDINSLISNIFKLKFIQRFNSNFKYFICNSIQEIKISEGRSVCLVLDSVGQVVIIDIEADEDEEDEEEDEDKMDE